MSFLSTIRSAGLWNSISNSKKMTFWLCWGIILLLLMVVPLQSCDRSPNQTISHPSPLSVRITMKLESNAFTTKGLIPAQYTCDGQNISPPLSWDAPPTGTQSLALIIDDPDAPGGIFTHWVLYNLPSETRQLSPAVPTQAALGNGVLQGKNDFGNLGYGGPCPPRGTHRYFFKLYALDQPLKLASGATKEQLVTAMDGHILAAAELIGSYTRQN